MKKLNHPLVSLITPGWNGKKFVHRLLDSILNQTYDNIEYIYVDDGSTDGTKDIVLSYERKFKERNINFLYVYKENGGVSSAVQEGLRHVNGECLGWPEYDDILLPDSIEKRVLYLETHSDCAVVSSDAWLVSENAINKPYGVLSGYNANRYDKNHFVQALLTNSIFTAACHLVRMDAFDETHPGRIIYPSWIGPNWQMLLPLYFKYERAFIDDPLVYYVVRKSSISHSHDSLQKKLDAIEEYKRILTDTLDRIEMLESDREFYKKIMSEKYARDWMNLGFSYRNKSLFLKGYQYYQTHNLKVSNLRKMQRFALGFPLFYLGYKCLSKINFILSRIFYENSLNIFDFQMEKNEYPHP